MARTRRLLAAFAVAVAGSLVGLAPAAAPASAAPCAAGAVHVAMVVDFGDAVTVTSTCVGVSSGATGADALSARADQLHTAQPEFQGGLLCTIDGYPNPMPADCTVKNSDGTYAYWSYWHGQNGQWKYSNVGATFRVQADIVEGWRYLAHGAGNGQDAAPAGSPVATDTCPAATQPPATDVTTAPADMPAPSEQSSAALASATARPSPSAPTTSTEATSTTMSSTTTARRALSSGSSQAAPVVTIAAGARRGGGSPVGLFAGVAVVVALAVGGMYAVRRRSAAVR